MSISLSDYTLGAPGQGSYMDAVLDKHPEFIGQKAGMEGWCGTYCKGSVFSKSHGERNWKSGSG